MIYKVIVSNIKSEIIKSLVFKNFDLVKEYFKETFPFYNRDVTDNCISQSFTISNNGKPLYFINISRIEPITKISKRNLKHMEEALTLYLKFLIMKMLQLLQKNLKNILNK